MQKIKSFARNYGRRIGILFFSIIFLILAVCFCTLLSDKNESLITAHADACPYHTTPLTAGGTLNGGTYYLTGDLTINSSITVNGTVNICLNGNMLRQTRGSVFIMNAGTTLNLYDCGNNENHKHYYTKDGNSKYNFGSGTDYITGGVVTGGYYLYGGAVFGNNTTSTFNMYGGSLAGNGAEYSAGAVTVGIFNMYGGKICGNTSRSAGGVSVSNNCVFNMSGGEIYENRALDSAIDGGVGNYGNTTVSGSAKIYDNTALRLGVTYVSNLGTNKAISIGNEGFNEDAYIGITDVQYRDYDAGRFIAANNSSHSTSDLLKNYFFNDEKTHIHNYGALVPRQEAADCSHTGLEAHYQCSACSLYFDANKKQVGYDSLIIPAKPHTPVTDPAVAATCTSEGKTAGSHCSVCNTVITPQTATPKIPHTEVTDAGFPATCTTSGKTAGSHCSVCNTVTTQPKDIPPTGHTPVADPAVAATCTSEGKTAGSHCSVCNTVITPQTATPKTPHTEVTDAGFPATCTTSGKTAGSHCSVCNTVTTQPKDIPPTGHTPVADPAVAATCTSEGKTAGSHCSVCNTVITPQTATPKTPHTEVTDAGFPATCTTSGKTAGSHCSVCNTVTTKPTDIPPTGHTPVADPAVAPTCTSTGKTAGAHCSVCGDVITPQTEIPAKGHSYTSVVTPPTAENAGYTTYTCTVCGDTYNDDYTPALGHNYVAGTVVPPTCTDRGYTVYTCTDCGDSYNGDYTPALGHDYKLVCKWAADYSSVTAKLVCTVCGDEKQIAAGDIKVNDTADADGNTVKTVTVISDGKTYTESVTIPKPDNPSNPGDPDNPSNPGDPDNPSNPGDPDNPSNPSNPDDPEKPVISVDMGEDGKLTGKDENGNDIDLDEYLDYKYYDKDGNEVTPDEFVDGGEYTAVATVKPDKEQEFKDRFANGDDMIEYLKDKTYTFVYHVHKTTGCNGKFDWLLFICLAVLAFDVIMFILTMAIIKRRRTEEDTEDDDNDNDNDGGDDYTEGGGGRDNIIIVK